MLLRVIVLLTGLLGACASGETPEPGSLPKLAVPAGRPSGAKVRVLNAYTPAGGEPVALDIYPGSWVGDAEKPIVSVPYGTVSALFDPTVADEQGNMSLTAYPAGQNQSNGGHRIMAWTATLKGGEVITYYVTSGKDVDAEGRPRGNLFTYDHQFEGDEPRPGPGKGLLMIHGAALYDALENPRASLFYFSAGQGCARTFYEEKDSPRAQPIQHMGGPFYELEAGEVAGSIHEAPADSPDAPDCRTPPVLANLPIRLAAGEHAILFVFAPKPRDLRTLFVPLTR